MRPGPRSASQARQLGDVLTEASPTRDWPLSIKESLGMMDELETFNYIIVKRQVSDRLQPEEIIEFSMGVPELVDKIVEDNLDAMAAIELAVAYLQGEGKGCLFKIPPSERIVAALN